MRISDWSSDVCSSDLAVKITRRRVFRMLQRRGMGAAAVEAERRQGIDRRLHGGNALFGSIDQLGRTDLTGLQRLHRLTGGHADQRVLQLLFFHRGVHVFAILCLNRYRVTASCGIGKGPERSEEHTAELK